MKNFFLQRRPNPKNICCLGQRSISWHFYEHIGGFENQLDLKLTTKYFKEGITRQRINEIIKRYKELPIISKEVVKCCGSRRGFSGVKGVRGVSAIQIIKILLQYIFLL